MNSNRLEYIATRLLRVQIENDSAERVIRRYDSAETLFYCDPPYPHESRGDSKAYQFELSDEQHRDLAELLNGVKGKVAISGYDCELMRTLHKDWNIHKEKPKQAMSIKKERQEILWTNY